MALQSDSLQSAAPGEVRAQLQRILASRFFARSERMSRFLEYTVEQSLAGAADQVKEYVIGIEVFDRRRDYDPRVDPIVRVEARRLRSKLESYYSSAGKSDALVIDFPTGAYIPVFRFKDAPTAAPADTAIAVLPFECLNPGPEGDYFSDGLTEELIHLLTRVANLRVVAWHSAAQMRDRANDLQAVREQLKVDFVMRGSVRRRNGTVRVTAQLIDTKSGAYLWSEAYDRDMQDVFAIQEEIAGAIVATMKRFTGDKRQTAEPRLTRAVASKDSLNPEYYNLCLQARYYANKRVCEGLWKAAECYEHAIALDQSCALAHAGLADTYTLLADYGLFHPSESLPKAKAAAQRALELDPESAEACTSLAMISSLFEWRWSEAETLYRRAIALNPGYSTARHWFGVDFLLILGRFEEARPEILLARKLDPLSLLTHEAQAYLHLILRDYESAAWRYREILELDPNFYKGYSGLGRTHILMGRYLEAVELFQKARALAGDVPNILAALGQAQGLAGQTAEARATLGQLQTIAGRQYVPSTAFAILHLGLGEIDASLALLEKACERHEPSISVTKVHPVYDPLPREPRFEKMIDKIWPSPNLLP